jgi:hypothetical protein
VALAEMKRRMLLLRWQRALKLLRQTDDAQFAVKMERWMLGALAIASNVLLQPRELFWKCSELVSS